MTSFIEQLSSYFTIKMLSRIKMLVFSFFSYNDFFGPELYAFAIKKNQI